MTDVQSLDLETYLIEAGLLAPRIVCGSTAGLDGGRLLTRPEALWVAKNLLESTALLAGANIAFDFGCLAAADPSLLPLIFKAYAEGRVHDVQIAQALDAIAGGHLFSDPRTGGPLKSPTTGKQAHYSLEVVCDLVLGFVGAKKNDEWRLKYALLDDVPHEDWPPEAAQYPVDDAVNTRDAAMAQLGLPTPYSTGAATAPLRNLGDLAAQCETAWDLHLGAMWGIRTDRARVAALREKARAEHVRYIERFHGLGFFDKDGSKNTKAVKQAVVEAYWPDGRPGPCAAGCRGGKVISEKSGKPINCKACSGTGYDTSRAPQTETGGVRADRDALVESGDLDLEALGENEAEKILDTYLPFLDEGVDKPITLRPNVLVASGRTSYYGLIQLLPREGDVRSCIRARGEWSGSSTEYWFCSVDYAAVELCTLAQVCYWVLGHSQIMETINATGDPGMLHTALAASMAGVAVEEMVARLKGLRGPELKEWAKKYRQAAKALNFGLPGGMGACKLVLSKRKKSEGTTTAPDGTVYPGVRFCVLLGGAERCGVEKITEWRDRPTPPVCRACVELVDAELRPAWFRQWPEIKPYFQWVTGRVDDGGEFPCFGTERVRGGLDFTNGANNGFQALAADGAKNALRKLTRECYLDRDSPLWGTRPVFFVHDEIVAEMPAATAHLAGPRMARVMVDAMREYVPDVAVAAEPALMRFWYKAAEAVYVDGKLVPWEPNGI